MQEIRFGRKRRGSDIAENAGRYGHQKNAGSYGSDFAERRHLKRCRFKREKAFKELQIIGREQSRKRENIEER